MTLFDDCLFCIAGRLITMGRRLTDGRFVLFCLAVYGTSCKRLDLIVLTEKAFLFSASMSCYRLHFYFLSSDFDVKCRKERRKF